MVTSPVIETAVGLLMVFYALALLCAGAVELIATWTKKRAKYLLRGLQDLVDADRQVGSGPPVDPRDWMHDARSEAHAYEVALAAGTGAPAPAAPPPAPTVTVAAIMGHGLVQPFKQTTATGRLTRNPSYLPSGVFSRVLVDLLDDPAADELSMATLRKRVAAAGGLSAPLQQALGGLARAAGDDVAAFTREVEGWFDAQMDRITGSYKRWAKRWVLVVATVVVLVCGVDSIAIAKALYTQDAVLAAVTQTAPADLCPEGASPEQCSGNAIAFFSEIGLPLGWTAPDPGFGAWAIPLKVLGLLLSIGAAGLGAPFWYRVLDRVGAIRNTGNRPETRSADG
jgi:hypothetical protein